MGTEKIKVLHMLTTDRYSGAENVVCQIAHMFQTEDRYEVLYCSPDGSIREALAEQNVSFVPMQGLSLSEFRRVIKSVNPDIVHAHDMKASVLAALAGAGRKLISHIHNSDFQARRVSVKSLLYLVASTKIKQIVWVSESCYNGYFFHGLVKSKSHILGNVLQRDSVVQRVKQDTHSYSHDVVYVGRIEDPKNPFRLIRILSIVSKVVDNLSVGIVGAGELLEETKQLACELGVDRNIVFYGFKQNPMKILQSAKVMVMTSDREGTPMVALEAMALGIPIVSTPVDGMCKLVDNGVTGYLQDDELMFANRVVSIINDDKLREQLSVETGKRFEQLCAPSVYCTKLRSLYEKL